MNAPPYPTKEQILRLDNAEVDLSYIHEVDHYKSPDLYQSVTELRHLMLIIYETFNNYTNM
jgi:hypothetical protein